MSRSISNGEHEIFVLGAFNKGTKTLVVYDITNSRTRTKVANALKDYGLERIQYSAFSGILEAYKKKELLQKLTDILGDKPGKILLVPLCEADYDKRTEIIVDDPPDENEQDR